MLLTVKKLRYKYNLSEKVAAKRLEEVRYRLKIPRSRLIKESEYLEIYG